MELEILKPKKKQRKCKRCGKEEHKARELCRGCYQKFYRKIIVCKICGRKRVHGGYGLCRGCHVRIHHYESVKAYNARRYHGIDLERWNRVRKKCVSCGFTKLVDLHHLDGDKGNKSETNLIGLCPNCHKMIHSYQYFDEMIAVLQERGYDTSKARPSSGKGGRSKKGIFD